MHLVTLSNAGRPAPGVIVGDHILDLAAAAAALPGAFPKACMLPDSMRGILELGDEALGLIRALRAQVTTGSESFRQTLRAAHVLLPTESVTLLAPIPNPNLVLSAGLNYGEHLKEMKGTPRPPTPTAFYKSTSAIIGTGAPIVPPPDAADMLDWEGEFSAVIGRTCHRVAAADALDYVMGYTLINDVSARNWVAPVFKAQGTFPSVLAWEHNILGKQFPTFCPMGPTIVTKDELPNPDKVYITTSLNGHVMQSACTDDLIYGVRALIEHFSKFYRLVPGDVITTGSPSGVGFGRNPQVFMKAGDVVTVHMKEIGSLSNPIASPA